VSQREKAVTLLSVSVSQYKFMMTESDPVRGRRKFQVNYSASYWWPNDLCEIVFNSAG